MWPASPWTWHGPPEVVRGRLWGGCLEILDWTLQVGRWIGPPSHYRGTVLFVETSEEMPSPSYVARTLRNLGERGILSELGALLVGRPVASPFGQTATPSERRAIEAAQREAVLAAVEPYTADLRIVIGVDAGHTDPQQILPMGGAVEIDDGSIIVHHGLPTDGG